VPIHAIYPAALSMPTVQPAAYDPVSSDASLAVGSWIT
jgi:hypothetical protein